MEAVPLIRYIKKLISSQRGAFFVMTAMLLPLIVACGGVAIDMGNFYAVPADNRDLNYDKYFKEGDVKRALIEEFNSNNTRILNLEETKEKIASLEYIQNELNGIPNIVK